MSGKVTSAAPWMKRALADFSGQYPDALAALEDAIPDGCHINLICNGRPRPLGAILWDDVAHREVARVEPGYPTVSGACYAALAAARTVAA